MSSLKHIDVHLSVGCCFSHVATAIYVFDTCCRFYIYLNVAQFPIDKVWQRSSILILTRECCLVTTAHKVSYDNGLTWVALLNIHDNVSTDTAALVVTAIYVLEITCSNGQMYTTCNLSLIGTTADILDLRVLGCTS